MASETIRFRASKPNCSILIQDGRRINQQHMRAAAKATHRAGKLGQRRTRQAMVAAGLGKLEKVVGFDSSFQSGGANGQLRPWAVIYAKGQSRQDDRGAGALESYSEGAVIHPSYLFGSGWLWIPTRAIPKRINRFRATPALYNRSNLVASIGPLVFIQKSSNKAVLVVKNVKVSVKTGRAKALGVRRPRTAKIEKSVVAFVGIKITRRMKRFDQRQIMRLASTMVPQFIGEELRGEQSRVA